ncbi:TVP38/TMEM64 family protein [Halovenus marina]|uniref:TVP38/TMEM64 family protein n=1 Tax=Halovenus marina TaxID=3396621 RepID=UPI003F570CF1
MKSLLWRTNEVTRGVFTSKAARRRAILWLFVIGIALFGSAIVLRRYVPWLTDPEGLRLGIEAYGPLAPVVFILVQATQVIVAPIPGQVLGFVSGYLFGMALGTLYSLIGAAIGSYVVFRLSRRYGRSYVERSIDPSLIDRFDTMTQRRGLTALFLIFLIPGIPDDAICFVAGLTDIRIRDMVIVSVIGRLPGYAVANAAGAQFAAHRLTEMALLLGVLVVLTGVGYLKRDDLFRRLGGPAA